MNGWRADIGQHRGEASMPIRLAATILAAGAFVALLGAAALPALAATIAVTTTQDSGPGSLREALALAGDGDTIDATGVSGVITLTSGELAITRSVTINGPGRANLTIDGNVASRAFSIEAPGATVAISGLTIANGRVGFQQTGGGIQNFNANLSLRDCALTGNASELGGAIYHHSNLGFSWTLTLLDCTLDGNAAGGVTGGHGGGIYNDGGVVQVTRSRLSNNSANGGGNCCNQLPAGRGGAIFNDNGQVMLDHATITGNSATRPAAFPANDPPGGGAIYNAGGARFTQAFLTIFDSTLSDNEAKTNVGLGGAIFNDGQFSGSATTAIVRSTLSGNVAGESGGAIFSDGSDSGHALVQIENSTLSGNRADTCGGGIYNVGVLDGDATVQIASSTLSDNAAACGGTILNFGASLEITSTILMGASGGTIDTSGGPATSHGHNLSSDSGGGVLTAPSDQVDTDPELGPLQDNGGPTFTHELLAGSPAIDAGPAAETCPGTDQRGVGRPQGAACDIGALEHTALVLPPTITSFTPARGGIGAAVTITGTALSWATSVTFNGAPASVTANTATRITVAVPADATSGPIRVQTPFGSATSANAFTAAPRITGFSPGSGGAGASVVIAGANFTGATAVKFHGVAGAFHVDSAAQITAVIPSNATSGPIAVTTPGGTATSAASFGVAPRITGFTPASGVVGASVTINGANFTGATTVTLNGTPATFAVTSATRIIATVPAGTTSGRFAVTTPAGTASSANAFTVHAAPTIDDVSPGSGGTGARITVSGTNFTGATAVKFNGTAASFTVDSAVQITAIVPAGATSGPISVATPGGIATSAVTFAAAPRITGFMPARGLIGASVTINGANFTGATSVTFNGTPAAFTVDTPTRITATVPADATKGKVAVSTTAGTATSAGPFTVKPDLVSFTPGNGAAGAGVTISGTGFTGTSSVKFNGAAAVFQVQSSTQITATVPANARTGRISVTTPGATATSAASFVVP